MGFFSQFFFCFNSLQSNKFPFSCVVWKWLKSVHRLCYEVGKPNYFVVSVPIKLFIQMFRFNQLISFDLCQSAIISAGWEVVFIITNLWFLFSFIPFFLSLRLYVRCYISMSHFIKMYVIYLFNASMLVTSTLL